MDVGQTYRLDVLVPPEHVAAVRRSAGASGQRALLADIERRIETSGYSPVLSVLEDASDPSLFHAIARYRSSGEPSGITIRSSVPVEEPPAAIVTAKPGRALDPGLTDEEVRAIRTALASDTNPRHLNGFAHTLSPFFPVAASILTAKAALVEGQVESNARALFEANSKLAGERARALVQSGEAHTEDAALAAVTAVRDPVRAITRALREAGAAWPDVEEALKRIRVPVYPWHGRGPSTVPIAPLRAAFEAYVASSVTGGRTLPLSVARDEVRRVASDVVGGEAEKTRGAPRPLRDLGLALVDEAGYGIDLVRLPRLTLALPPTGDEGYVSPTTLHLVLASYKPEFSRIADPRRGAARLGDVAGDKGHPADRLRARNQVERAERAIERRRWIDWYRRTGW